MARTKTFGFLLNVWTSTTQCEIVFVWLWDSRGPGSSAQFRCEIYDILHEAHRARVSDVEEQEAE